VSEGGEGGREMERLWRQVNKSIININNIAHIEWMAGKGERGRHRNRLNRLPSPDKHLRGRESFYSFGLLFSPINSHQRVSLSNKSLIWDSSGSWEEILTQNKKANFTTQNPKFFYLHNWPKEWKCPQMPTGQLLLNIANTFLLLRNVFYFLVFKFGFIPHSSILKFTSPAPKMSAKWVSGSA